MSGKLGLSGSRENSKVTNPEAMGAAKELIAYLNKMDTSNVDQAYQNIGKNALNLTTGLPDYVYNVGASDEQRQKVENATYQKASEALNSQYASDLSALETRLQNQGLAVGSDAYQNALGTLQNNHYSALNNAAYDSMIKGQEVYTNQLNNSINAANFTNSARQMSLSEILDVLQNSVSGYKAAHDKFDAMSGASSQKTSGSKIGANYEYDSNKDIKSATKGFEVFKGLGFSDSRLKENIVAVGRLDNGLTVYRFNFLGSETTQIGLIAQEVEIFKPEAVSKSEDGYLMVDYVKATEK